MNITIRREIQADYRAVEELTREAFWNVHVPGCNEHYLVHTIRNSKDFFSDLDMVAEIDGEIVGNIIYARSYILQEDNVRVPVITFGPLSVLPSFQGRGIGGLLIETTRKLAARMGFNAILIYGDPDYYTRFGFEPAEKYGIRSSQGLFACALQVCELYPGALDGVSGKFEEGDAYQVDPDEAEDFDQTFPFKEKRETPSQTRFLELVKMVHD